MKSDFTKCSPEADIPDVWASEETGNIFSLFSPLKKGTYHKLAKKMQSVSNIIH